MARFVNQSDERIFHKSGFRDTVRKQAIRPIESALTTNFILHPTDNFQKSINLSTCTSLECGRKPKHLEQTHVVTGET